MGVTIKQPPQPPDIIRDAIQALAPVAAQWGLEILDTYKLDATGRALVLQASQALDTVESARAERAQLVTDGRYEGSSRQAPLLVVERQARADYLACLRALKLDRD